MDDISAAVGHKLLFHTAQFHNLNFHISLYNMENVNCYKPLP